MGQGQNEDNDVAGHVDSTKGVCLGVEVIAFTLVYTIPAGPVERSRQTLKTGGNHCSCSTKGDKDTNDQCQLFELRCCEDTAEEKQNGNLGAVQMDTVHDLINPEEFE